MKTIDKSKSLKENCLIAMNNKYQEPIEKINTCKSESTQNLTQRKLIKDKKIITKEPET